MHESLPHCRGRLPLGLAGMLVIVAAVEVHLALHETCFMKFFTYDWIFTARAARSKAASADVLCLGDSLIKFGVAPRVLEERLGMKAYNLAVCGGQAPSSYFLLRRAIEAGARPKAIIVDFMPHLLDHGPRMNMRQWPVLVSLRDLTDLVATARNASFAAIVTTSALLPSLRARFEIRQCITSAIEGEKPAQGNDLSAYERNWRTDLGAQLSPARDTTGRRYNLERWEDYTRAWRCHAVNAVYINRLLALAERNNVAVYWLLPPVSAGIEVRRERLGVDERHARFLRDLQRQHPALVIVDGRHASFDPALFLDPLHLDRRGAQALSVALADVLARHLRDSSAGTPRWVSLPQPEPSRLANRADLREGHERVRGARGVRAN